MKKISALCLAIMVLVGVLAGCGEDQSPYQPTGDALYSEGTTQPIITKPVDQTQIMRMVYDPTESFNPYQTADSANRLLMPLIYQGLFQLNPDYEPVPILCSGYSVSSDMKVYTFYLENATFPDGTALTAADVVASLKAASTGPVYRGRLGYVQEIAATEDGAVTVRLSIPYENFPILLDIPIVKASDVKEEKPVGTGAYFLEDRAGSVQLVRRDNWWCNANLVVTAPVIPLVEGLSNAQIRDEFEYGNVDVVCADPGSDLYVDFRSDYELWSCENGIFLYLACNEKSAVFANQTVRKALTYAIDRAALVENYYRSFATAATLPAAPNSPYYSKGLASRYDYDPAILPAVLEEEQLLEQTITILVNKKDSRRVRVARAIAQMLNEGGLKTVTSELVGDSYTKALKNGKYDLHLGQTMLSPNMDLTAFYAAGGALNYGNLGDAAILTVCQEALANSGNYYTLHQMVMEDAMLCPILFRSYAIYTERGIFPELTPVRDNVFFYDLGKTMEDIYIP